MERESSRRGGGGCSKSQCSGHGRAFLDVALIAQNYLQDVLLMLIGILIAQNYLQHNYIYSMTLLKFFLIKPAVTFMHVASGDPIYLEPFWMQMQRDTAVVISGWHRMSYEYADDPYDVTRARTSTFVSYIQLPGMRSLKTRYIVFGVGSSQLLSAAVYALSSQNSSSPSNVLASTPFYHLYKDQNKVV
ncbi:putative alliin lyase [Helianthus annuus]|nr:putative alliin lyase [Helianthus annuus]